MVLNKNCTHNEWLKFKFFISNDLTNLKVLFNDYITFDESVSLKNIESFKNKCVLYKIS